MNFRPILLATLAVFFTQSCGLKGALVLPAPSNHLNASNADTEHSCLLLCIARGEKASQQ
jgi:predicted small lipoprotein YifL